MKGTVKDTIWFGKENGSSMKISWEGYSTEHVESLKQTFIDQGWLVLYHQHKVKNEHKWLAPMTALTLAIAAAILAYGFWDWVVHLN